MIMKAVIIPPALLIAVFFIFGLGALPYASGEDKKILKLQSRNHRSNPQDIRGREDEAPSAHIAGPNQDFTYWRQMQQIGSPYFHPVGQSIVGVDGTDQDSFGRSISMSDNGMMLAVSGNLVIIPEEEFVGYVDLYQFDENLNKWINLQANITTSKIANKADVEVFLSGDGMRLAIASVYKENSSGDSFGVVTVYENSGEAWETIGTPVTGGFRGDRPGLKISMSYTGDRLAVGSRYYTDASDNINPKVYAGRTRIFQYESGDWKQLGSDLVGDSEADYAGSSVALTPDGLTLAVGATGDDSSEKNTGRVKVYTFNANRQEWDLRGNEIIGESGDDDSGFAIAIAKGGSRVAVGAIYNDGDNGDLRHSGHVRVYDFKSTENAWKQIGSDIDGDHGSIYDGNYFHIGDAFGFSVAMSTDGNKLAIGAPFYSKNRQSGYYGGVAKLYEFESNQWNQVAYDLNVTDTDATSGYSVALSSNGKRFAIGTPSPDLGMVLVYDQYEVSDFPSLAPTTTSSNIPSLSPIAQPSSKPSRFPSDIPSKQPSTRPSSQPSFLPSKYPTTSPSTTPSNGPTVQPSGQPSNQPSNIPSSYPSAKPSAAPSLRPSEVQSDLPSVLPSISPSTEPSSRPSDIPSVLPSISPSAEPSSEPSSNPSNTKSATPSTEPSNVPSKKPSTQPSTVPSFRPSNIPSIYPSDHPSFFPSNNPSARPSIMPSLRASSDPSNSPMALPSTQPSQTPTSISDRTFKIRSSFALFEKLSDDDITWCMQASGFGDDSILNVGPCNSNPYQLWYLDSSRNLRLRKFPSFCIVYEGKKLYIRSCDEASPLEIDTKTHSISVTKRNNKRFYICVDTFKAFSKLSLMKDGRSNSSWNTWHIEYQGPSLAPSVKPSYHPSSRPSSDTCVATFSNGYTDTAQNGDIITINVEANGGVGYSNITMVVSGCSLPASMHLWGAGGGGTKKSGLQTGGNGGYSTGLYTFQPGTYSIIVGGAGEGASQSPHLNNAYGAYDTGGGRAGRKELSVYDGAGGGGLTGIFSGSVAHNNSIIIAGGGGGGSGYPAHGAKGGSGGGLSGENGSPFPSRAGSGGSQSEGGSASPNGGFSGGQLQGGNGNWNGAGGGGGYYGGAGGGGGEYDPGSGAGGSGYIGGVTRGGFTASGSTDASIRSSYWQTPVGRGGVQGSGGGRGAGGQITIVFGAFPTNQPSLSPSVRLANQPSP